MPQGVASIFFFFFNEFSQSFSIPADKLVTLLYLWKCSTNVQITPTHKWLKWNVNCHEEPNWIHECLNCVIYHWDVGILLHYFHKDNQAKNHKGLAEQWGVLCSDKWQAQVVVKSSVNLLVFCQSHWKDKQKTGVFEKSFLEAMILLTC